ncbi:type II toxin-antitoxin system HicA family toxin [Clostridium sp. AM33-3]|mgnify:CR=1 FL=1|uniref:type II toxin-antitoxin system HicA family toxin n=1 Tax=Clostridium sp. AM33-3 TaxID=2292304 RepID=UPI000E4B1AE5|nr:type II toxin-antitoxin system HicA family toxin [Clostridium sp. AM33-3]
MRYPELTRMLSDNRCYLLRHGTNHDIWHSEITGKNFPVPRHKAEIPTGTLKNILKDAGLN